MAAKKTVWVRVNASHDGLRVGRVYELDDTPDLAERIKAGRLTKLTAAQSKRYRTTDEDATDGD